MRVESHYDEAGRSFQRDVRAMPKQPAKESSRGPTSDRAQKFTAVVTTDSRKRMVVPVPFDPDNVWGPKPQHHVAGTMNGGGVRAVLERVRDGHAIFNRAGVATRLRDRGRR